VQELASSATRLRDNTVVVVVSVLVVEAPTYTTGSDTAMPLTVRSPVVTASMPDTARRFEAMDVPRSVLRVEDELVRAPLCTLATADASVMDTVDSTATDPAESVTVTSEELTVLERAAEKPEATAARTADVKSASRLASATRES
jgi:hypothetical protein